MCVCIYIHIYIYIYIHIHTHTHTPRSEPASFRLPFSHWQTGAATHVGPFAIPPCEGLCIPYYFPSQIVTWYFPTFLPLILKDHFLPRPYDDFCDNSCDDLFVDGLWHVNASTRNCHSFCRGFHWVMFVWNHKFHARSALREFAHDMSCSCLTRNSPLMECLFNML